MGILGNDKLYAFTKETGEGGKEYSFQSPLKESNDKVSLVINPDTMEIKNGLSAKQPTAEAPVKLEDKVITLDIDEDKLMVKDGKLTVKPQKKNLIRITDYLAEDQWKYVLSNYEGQSIESASQIVAIATDNKSIIKDAFNMEEGFKPVGTMPIQLQFPVGNDWSEVDYADNSLNLSYMFDVFEGAAVVNAPNLKSANRMFADCTAVRIIGDIQVEGEGRDMFMNCTAVETAYEEGRLPEEIYESEVRDKSLIPYVVEPMSDYEWVEEFEVKFKNEDGTERGSYYKASASGDTMWDWMSCRNLRKKSDEPIDYTVTVTYRDDPETYLLKTADGYVEGIYDPPGSGGIWQNWTFDTIVSDIKGIKATSYFADPKKDWDDPTRYPEWINQACEEAGVPRGDLVTNIIECLY